jgi:hypothetical protein
MNQRIFGKHFSLRKEHFVLNGIESAFGWVVNPIMKKDMNKNNSEIILVNQDYGFPYYLYRVWYAIQFNRQLFEY